ncbi:hypothetical protein F7734_48995 [Scytonema sp. UIC 10036]|nr:hypothetical protein [Scytonema sp. UIC 10036]MUG99795.1 hypothetical protein [Scytonema sp. UIC 10036]
MVFKTEAVLNGSDRTKYRVPNRITRAQVSETTWSGFYACVGTHPQRYK